MPLKNRALRLEYNRDYWQKHRESLCTQKRSYWKETRLKVLSHYSKGTLQCKCCGENVYQFLSIDHIKGGGNKHRRSLGSKYIYSWLITHDFPRGFQVLCHNCNMAKAFYKVCPHKEIVHGSNSVL